MQPYGSFGHDGGKAGGFLKSALAFGFSGLVSARSAAIVVCGPMARLIFVG